MSLPLNAVTQKLGWIGVSGSGKSYGASKLAELFWEAKAQFVVLDPVGIWYGLRLAKDGKGAGIPIPVFGGLHGDVPLESTNGFLMADLVVDRGISAVLDVSQFESDAQKARFCADFAERLFFRKKAAPSAIHLFIEECQEFVPQNPSRGEEMMLHRFHRIQKIGRNFGIGTSLITQRPQETSKKALNQAQTLFVFRLTGKHERKAIDEWIEDKHLEQDLVADLPKIETGHCHFWSPQWMKISHMIHIAAKHTFDASETPEVGVRSVVRDLTPIDLDRIRKDMTDTIEKAKAEDPKALRARIAQLEREAKSHTVKIASLSVSTPSQTPKIERVEVPILRESDFKRLEITVCRFEKMSSKTQEALLSMTSVLGKADPRNHKIPKVVHPIYHGVNVLENKPIHLAGIKTFISPSKASEGISSPQ